MRRRSNRKYSFFKGQSRAPQLELRHRNFGVLIARKDRPWAKAFASTLTPVCIALAIVAVCAVLFAWLKPEQGAALLSTEDRLTLRAYHLLKPLNPSWWLYTLILLGTSWFSWRSENTAAVTRVKTTKKWLGKTLAVITLLASFTLASDAMVIAPHLHVVRGRLELRYENAKERKEQASVQYLAERTVTTALLSMKSTEQANFQQVFRILGHSSASLGTERRLGKAYAERDRISLDGLEQHTPLADDIAPRDSDTIPTLARKVEAEEAAQAEAEAVESQARAGLKEATAEVLGEGNGVVLEAASEYLSKLVDLYAGQYADTVKPLLNDFLEPATKKAAGAYLDKLIGFAADRCHWQGLPHASPGLISLQLQVDALALNRSNVLGTVITSELEGNTILANAARTAEATATHTAEKDAVAQAAVIGSVVSKSVAEKETTAMFEHEAAVAAERAAARTAEKDIVGTIFRTLAHAL